MTVKRREATAFAPATVGNAAVGYDILGFALSEPGDRVTVKRLSEPVVEIEEVSGVVTDLPRDPAANTATVGLLEIIADLGLDFGFRVAIEKGIPLGSGMGGSAASAVASVVAASALLERELTAEHLLHYALAGEAVATGARHGDNVASCLFGGLCLVRGVDPMELVKIPVPDQVRFVVVRPEYRVDTRRARAAVPRELPLGDVVGQTANLAGFVAACHQGDLDLLGRCLEDVMIEPHRRALIPGFDGVKDAALRAGALGASISGAGPSVFAWCREPLMEEVASQMVAAFSAASLEATAYTGEISRAGAYVVDEKNRAKGEGR